MNNSINAAVIFADGLRKSQTQWIGKELCRLRIRTEKISRVREEESDALTRLADAIAGFVRAALSGRKEMEKLPETAKADGYIRELRKKKNPRHQARLG